MSSTRQALPEQTIKVEEPLPQLNSPEPMCSDNIPRKRVREDIDANGALQSTSSGRVKVEEVSGLARTCDRCTKQSARRGAHEERERLRNILKEAILMKEAIIEQNNSLRSELRRTRHELHRMWRMMDFAGVQLQEEAARRFRGIDSDTASEDELEDPESERENN
ncbi:hypothetical protein B0H19DRAFT_1142189 [Mycena capillaripes]|nr:hypothetical protein B0H19DRAFT_1142189 [Mycena capillaripes]